MNDACNGSYNGQPTTVKLLRPVLYYYYVITCVSPGNQINVTFDVDHIIPKEIFESNVIDGLKEKLGDDFEVFYNDYLKVQQEYKKL